MAARRLKRATRRRTELPEQVATRLYNPSELIAGQSVALDAPQTHRLRNVLRLGPGAAVAVFNETAGEWLGRLVDTGRNRYALQVEQQLRPPEATSDIWLLFAPLKRTRLDWLVEKTTELGIAALYPVWTARTQPERLNRERLAAIATAAAEQSERLSVPEIFEPRRLDGVIAAWPAKRPLIVCDETGGGIPIAEALPSLLQNRSAALFVGPEGGFAETELDALGKLPNVTRVGLGPRVLRAETAALAAVAVFQALAGDWCRARPR